MNERDHQRQLYEFRKPIVDKIRQNALKDTATDIDRLAAAINLLAGAIHDSAMMLASPQVTVDEPNWRETMERALRKGRKIPEPEPYLGPERRHYLAFGDPVERRQVDRRVYNSIAVSEERRQHIFDTNPTYVERRQAKRRAV